MLQQSSSVNANAASAPCKIKDWHPITKCENSEGADIQRLRKLKSDLFTSRGYDVPAPQKARFAIPHNSLTSSLIKSSMERNHAVSPFLRLPPEIRVRIYGLVLGGNVIWIEHIRPEVRYKPPPAKTKQTDRGSPTNYHQGEGFRIFTARELPDDKEVDFAECVDMLHVCRQVYMEAALLPFALNKFLFEDDVARKVFEQGARPGKKRAQKKAVGSYEIVSWKGFNDRYLRKTWREGIYEGMTGRLYDEE